MNSFNTRVLIIDDDESIREAYDVILSMKNQAGHKSQADGPDREQGNSENPMRKGPYELSFAENGESGIEQVEQSMEQNRPFAVIFIDMMMTGIDGAETAREIWKIDPRAKIIVVTASVEHKPHEIVQTANRDDIFYLRKPFKASEIRQFARALASQWNLEQEKEQLSAELSRARELEIETASAIQKTLLLGKPPEGVRGIITGQRTIPSQTVDGDFYDFYSFREGTLDIVVGDVMGKGVTAALLGAALKSKILLAINMGLVSNQQEDLPEPRVIIDSVHSEMIKQLEELESFVTLCYARFDLKKGKFSLVDCGHTRTVYYDGTRQVIRLLQGENTPLGFPVFEPHSQISLDIKPGDLFFFYSDGLTESRNPTGDFFGEERLVQLVTEYHDDIPDQLIENIYDQVLSFSQSKAFNDDLTFVVVKVVDNEEDKVTAGQMVLEIRSAYPELKKVREFTRSFCNKMSDFGLEKEQVENIILAVNEVVANIMNHTYQEKPDEPIRLNFGKDGNQLIFEFIDWGETCFAPDMEKVSLPDDQSVDGRGLFIINSLADEITYSRNNLGQNQTILTVALKK